MLAGSLLLSPSQVLASGATTDAAKGESKKMKIVFLTGSPRKNGNMNHMADQFEKGAKEAGYEFFASMRRKAMFGPAWAAIIVG